MAHGIWAAGAISVPVVPIYRGHELAAIMRCRATEGRASARRSSAATIMSTCSTRPPEPRTSRPHCGSSCAVRPPGWISWDDAQRATPFVHDAIDPGAPVIVGLHVGHDLGREGCGDQHPRDARGPDAPRARVPYTFRDRAYMPAPVSHITGLLMAVTLPLVSGCSVLLAERWDAAKAVADMMRHGVTYSGGAAVFIQELVDAVDAAGTGLVAARAAATTAAAVRSRSSSCNAARHSA